MQKTSLCQVFMAAISSNITKIDKRKTFQLLMGYARLKLKNYVPSRAKRMSPLLIIKVCILIDVSMFV